MWLQNTQVTGFSFIKSFLWQMSSNLAEVFGFWLVFRQMDSTCSLNLNLLTFQRLVYFILMMRHSQWCLIVFFAVWRIRISWFASQMLLFIGMWRIILSTTGRVNIANEANSNKNMEEYNTKRRALQNKYFRP